MTKSRHHLRCFKAHHTNLFNFLQILPDLFQRFRRLRLRLVLLETDLAPVLDDGGRLSLGGRSWSQRREKFGVARSTVTSVKSNAGFSGFRGSTEGIHTIADLVSNIANTSAICDAWTNCDVIPGSVRLSFGWQTAACGGSRLFCSGIASVLEDAASSCS